MSAPATAQKMVLESRDPQEEEEGETCCFIRFQQSIVLVVYLYLAGPPAVLLVVRKALPTPRRSLEDVALVPPSNTVRWAACGWDNTVSFA